MDTPTTEIYTLSLHDALPIWSGSSPAIDSSRSVRVTRPQKRPFASTTSASSIGCFLNSAIASSTLASSRTRSEEHTSELQSLRQLVCRLLLDKKKQRLELKEN